MNDETLVFGNLTQAELDGQYDPHRQITDNPRYMERWRSWSASVRESYEFETLAYGPGEHERIDLFHGGADNTGLVVFFHGGAWTRNSKELFHYIAESMVTDGFAYAAVEFDRVPDVTLAEQIEQTRAAVEYLVRNPKGYSGEEIYLVGHATGAHLAAMSVTTNWPERLGVETCPIKGGMLVSGIYDLEPVRLSNRNEYLRLDAETARQLSPIEHVREHPCPIVIGWGTDELDEFSRQSRHFADAWRRAGGRCNAFELPTSNYLDMSLELGDPDGPLLKAFLNLEAEAT
jgi:arylformamidase